MVGALSGAIFSSAILLLGSAIEHSIKRQEEKENNLKQINKIKTLITKELDNVVAGYLYSKEHIDAAIQTHNAGGTLPEYPDLII